MFTLLLLVQAMTVTSQVDSVVVYPYQVQVVREASVTVSGSGELAFPGLPGALVDNTVRVKARGMRIGEVQVKPGYMAEPTPEVRRLEERVRQLEDEKQALDDEAAVLQAKEQFLNSVKLGSPEIIARELQQGKVATESWRGALNFVAEEMMRVKGRAIALSRQREERQRQLAAARQEYQAARALVESRKEVRFDFAAEAGTYEVEMSYVVPSAASWSPYYELRARPGDGKVEVSYFAKLEQRTGENWERVKVVLSTMSPASDLAAPQPIPWYLSFLAAERTRGGFHAMDKLEAVPSAEADDGEMAATVAEAPPPPVETGISLQYPVPGRITLASGEPAKKIGLHNELLAAEFEYYTLSRAREQAFLTGRLVNVTDFVLLSGQASTYVGDEYTGSTWMPAVAPQESTELSFGADERVKVKRELVRSKKTRAGLFGKTERQSYVYRTTIENYLGKAVTIKVIEQVPVSQQGDIKVSVTKLEPRFLEENKDEGTYTWKPVIEPRGRFELNLEFNVEYPAGRPVSGLY